MGERGNFFSQRGKKQGRNECDNHQDDDQDHGWDKDNKANATRKSEELQHDHQLVYRGAL